MARRWANANAGSTFYNSNGGIINNTTGARFVNQGGATFIDSGEAAVNNVMGGVFVNDGAGTTLTVQGSNTTFSNGQSFEYGCNTSGCNSVGTFTNSNGATLSIQGGLLVNVGAGSTFTNKSGATITIDAGTLYSEQSMVNTGVGTTLNIQNSGSLLNYGSSWKRVGES